MHWDASNIQVVEDLGRKGFLEEFGLTGRIGLFGGRPIGHRLVRFAQSPITRDRRPSLWSHVVIFSNEEEGHLLYESDFEVSFSRLRIRNGAQRSRIEKYMDPKRWPHLVILDFALHQEKQRMVIEACRRMIAADIKYPIFGLLRAGFAYLTKRLNRSQRPGAERALFCSAFVQQAFKKIGLYFQEGVPAHLLGPEHIWQTPLRHTVYTQPDTWKRLSERNALRVGSRER